MTTPRDRVGAGLRAAVADARPGLEAADDLCRACVGLLDMDGAAVSMVYEGVSRGTFGASSDGGRRLDEYQFTYGEGPCLDAVADRRSVHAPDLPTETRWPLFSDAALGDGVRAVFALPIMITSACVGALDLFRAEPGTLTRDQHAGAALAAQLAAQPLLHLLASDLAGVQHPGETSARGSGTTPADMDRVEVYQATGILISQLDVSAADAALRLRAHAVATGQTASEVGIAIIERRLFLDRDDRGRPDAAGGPT